MARRRAAAGLGPALALLLAAGLPATAQPDEASGGYWRSRDDEGYYRVRVARNGDGSRVEIAWISGSGRTRVASTTFSDLGEDGPWQVVNPELRAEDDRTLLTLDAHNPWTDARRRLTVELGEPGVSRLRDR